MSPCGLPSMKALLYTLYVFDALMPVLCQRFLRFRFHPRIHPRCLQAGAFPSNNPRQASWSLFWSHPRHQQGSICEGMERLPHRDGLHPQLGAGLLHQEARAWGPLLSRCCSSRGPRSRRSQGHTGRCA